MRDFFIWFRRIARGTWLVFGAGSFLLVILKLSGIGWSDAWAWWQVLSPILFSLAAWLVWLLYLWLDTLAVLLRRSGDKVAQSRLSERIRERNRIDLGQRPKEWNKAERKVLEAQAIVRRRLDYWTRKSKSPEE